jgi:hypothetical protein
VTWILANIIPAVAIWGAMSGIPLWLVLKRRYAEGVPAHPVPAKVTTPADRPLAVERELVRAHRDRASAQRERIPVRLPVPAAR